MTELETRLKSQLGAQSDSLPSSPFGSDAAIGRAAQRRRRSRVASSIGGLVLVAGLAAGLGALTDLGPDRSETVFADRPELVDRGDDVSDIDGNTKNDDADDGESATDEDRSVLEVNPTTIPSTVPATDGTTGSTPASGEEATGATAAPGVGPSTGGPAADLPPTAEAIRRLGAENVLFHSDNEGCADLPDGRGHPDWIEGQAGNGVNDDGTPTHGFAFNTGDSTGGEIDWGFVPRADAPSGRCVLALTLNRADDSSHAIRLFRRYDRNGNTLPADAYYSVWLYFPQVIEFERRGTVDGQPGFGFWNVFQIKNDLAIDDGRGSLSALAFGAGKLPDEDVMSLSAYSKVPCVADEECDEAFTITQADPVPIPTGRWVHFELRLRSRTDEGGRMEVWQDGQRILTYSGPTERPNTVRRTWSLTSMGHLHRTARHTLYADDPLISTKPVHPELFGP